jgi:hypothetical protein
MRTMVTEMRGILVIGKPELLMWIGDDGDLRRLCCEQMQ